jgi:uncharacterized integral membrane protein
MKMNDLHQDSSFPLGFIVLPTFVGALVWLCVMLSRMQAM